jgi:hypothetical protein
MQRDMDLIRAILIAMESCPHGFARDLRIEGYTDEEIGFHAWLMKQAGLIDGVDDTNTGSVSPSFAPMMITWAGYEFLSASKDESTWRRATATVSAKTGALGFEVLKAWLIAEIKRQVGLP